MTYSPPVVLVAKKRKRSETSDLACPYTEVGWHREDDMVMLIQIAAGVLLLLGSALIFVALLEVDRAERPVSRRPMARPAPKDHELPRAA